MKKNSYDRGKVVKKQRWAMHRENIRVLKAGMVQQEHNKES